MSLIAITDALLLVASAAHAALTTEKCLEQKRKAWGDLRKCQATEDAKRLRAKAADLANCQTKLQPIVDEARAG